jgi:hypothetical protein
MKSAIELSTKNYLHVSIDLPTTGVADFVKLMKRLIPKFTSPYDPNAENVSFGWTLVAALRTSQGRSTRITHLWQVNPAQPSMTIVMGECGADPDYGKLDMLVDREVQDYMFTGPYLEAGATWPTRLPATCAVETLQVTRNPDDLLFFENGHLQMGKGMSELADRAEQEHGWTLLLPLTPETGLLRQFVHFWAIQKGGTQSVAVLRRWLTKQPEYRAGVLSSEIIAAEPIAYGRPAHRGRS